jgi:hypothetical protein
MKITDRPSTWFPVLPDFGLLVDADGELPG